MKVDGHAGEVLETLRALYESERRVNPLISSRRAKRALAPDPPG